jgi:dipeptidyl aminopeptidase/acylaminoacyl peptidase
VNYGGSTGFGREYRRRLNGQWGIVDVVDCIAPPSSWCAKGRRIRRG